MNLIFLALFSKPFPPWFLSFRKVFVNRKIVQWAEREREREEIEELDQLFLNNFNYFYCTV